MTALKWTPKVVYPGPQSPLILSWPQEFWTPSRRDIGGSRITGAGVTESFLARSDQLVNVGLRFFEAEQSAVDAWLAWASANAGTPFQFFFDQNVASTAYSVYLHSPVPGSGTSEPARTDFHQMFRQQIVLRSATGAPFNLKFFADQDPAVGITITPVPLTGTVGANVQLSVEITDANGIDILGRAITFSSSNAAIATVDANGIVTFTGAGGAFITVTSGSVSTTVPVTVSNPIITAPVASIVLTPTTFTVAIGGHQQMQATLYDGPGGTGNILTGRPISWASSDTSKATTDQTGYVTGIGTGGGSGGGSVSTAAVSDRQDATPHYLDWNMKWTDFYYGWTASERDWTAKHHDSQMSGDAAAFRNLNPTGQHSIYSLIYTSINTGGGLSDTSTAYYGAMQTWYASALNTFGETYESGWLHVRNGDIKYQTVKNITAVVAGNPATLTIPNHGYTSGQKVATTNMTGTGSGLVSTFYASGMVVIDANTITIPATATTSVTATGTGNVGQISNQIGDGTITPGNRKSYLTSFNNTRWFTNFGSPALRAYQLYRTQKMCTDPSTGVFWDECGTGGEGFNLAIPSVEYPTPNTAPNGGPYNNSFATYLTDLQTCLNFIRTSISPKEQWVNPAAYYNFSDDKNNVNAAGFGHLEKSMWVVQNIQGQALPVYTNYATMSNQPGFEMVAINQWEDPISEWTTSGASGTYTTKMHLMQGSCFVMGLLAMPEPSTDPYFRRVYFNSNNSWSAPPSTRWLLMWERDHGRPIIPTYTSATNILAPPTANTKYFTYSNTLVDSLGVTCTIRGRETSKALLLLNNSTTTSAAVNDGIVTVPLPAALAPLSLLKEDGSLGPTISSVNLVHGEGVVLIKTGGSIVTSGTFNITATSGGRSATSVGTVGAQTVATIALAPSTAQTIAPNGTFTLTATPKDASNATVSGATVTFTSSNTAVATVTAGGIVKGVAAGNATISASSQGVSNSVAVTVAASSLTPTTVVISPASVTVAVGSTQTFTATVYDQFGAVMTGQTVTWTSSNTGRMTVTSGGIGTGVAAGAVTITASVGSASANAAVTVATATGGGGSTTSNEPSGMTQLSHRTFTTQNEDGWSDSGTVNTAQYVVPATNTTYPEVGTPPIDANFLALVYPVGTSRGALGAFYRPGEQVKIGSPTPKQVYVRMQVFVGAGSGVGTTGFFSNHSTGINKLAHFLGQSFGPIWLVLRGTGGGVGDELRPGFYFQLIADSTYNGHSASGNANTTTFVTRGSWHTLEWRIVPSTPGVKDGICQAWVDGVLVTNYTDVMTGASGTSQNIPQMDISPNWGSPSGNAAQDITSSIPAANIYIGDSYWSGKSTLTP